MNSIIRLLDLQNIDLDTKIVILSALVHVMVKYVFLHNGQKWHVHVRLKFKLLKIFLDLLKTPDSSYLVLKFGNILPSDNWDMSQNMIS